MLESRGSQWMWTAVLAVGLLAGCASTSRSPAPVEDRNPPVQPQPAPPPAPAASDAVKLPVPTETAPKSGYFTVRPGDTLIRIALDSGNNCRDIARWNN